MPGWHDANAVRIRAPLVINLGGDGAASARVAVTVANEGRHLETIGVYVDVLPPADGGCLPWGRLLDTRVTLRPGARRTLVIDAYPGDPFPGDGLVTFNCANPLAASRLNYLWTLAADAHGDDARYSCSPGRILSSECFRNLSYDDKDPTDNIRALPFPIVVLK